MMSRRRFKNSSVSLEVERKIINLFMFRREDSYTEDEVFETTNWSQNVIPLAYTTKGDYEEFEIQVYLDVDHMRVVKVLTPYEWDEDINQYYYEFDYFTSIDKLLEFVEDVPDFDELIEVKKDTEEIKLAMLS